MPVFEELTIVQYIPTYSSTAGSCNGVMISFGSEAAAQAAEEICTNAGGEWLWQLSYFKQIALKNIDLEIITSFEAGRRAYDDPADPQTFAKGDDFSSETLVTLAGAMGTQIIVDMSLVTFRTLMARNF
jgi:hypothetical protein